MPPTHVDKYSTEVEHPPPPVDKCSIELVYATPLEKYSTQVVHPPPYG